jgi:RNA polymerase sporulation-specific sigma factor
MEVLSILREAAMPDINDTIASNVKLVYNQLHVLNLSDDANAESLGYEALYRAIKTYDPSKGYKLSTYATCCIYNALGSYIRTLNKKKQLVVYSYNAPVQTETCDEGHDYSEVIAGANGPEEYMLHYELKQKISEAAMIEYGNLRNKTQRSIVSTWYNAGCAITNKEVATLVGVSQPYVNQILSAFKSNMRKRLEEYYRA